MYEFLASFLGVFVTTYALVPISVKIGLLDKPDNERKHHSGAIPLIGGIAMFISITISSFLFVPPSREMGYLLAACALLAMTGSIDDKYDINYKTRLLIQCCAAGLLVWGGESHLSSLGNLFGYKDIQLNELGVPITFIAVIGMINAFNMIDGIDGLAGGVSMISCLALYILLGDSISDGASNILLLIIGALSAYLILNLHILPSWTPKIFMGDAGSMILGFILTAFTIRYSQGTKEVFHPVTAVWLVSIPLMDIAATSIRRIRHGKSPFHPDRTHVHHILMRTGLSSRGTLLLILLLQIVLASIGIMFQKFQINEAISLILFVIIFTFYVLFISHAFKVTKWIRRHVTRVQPPF